MRQRLASKYTASQLNLGYLIRQDGNRRGPFLSTSPRADAVSTQLDTQEAQGKLKLAGELAQVLSEAAVQHRA